MCKIVQNVRNVQNYAKFAKLYKICKLVQFCKIPKNGEYGIIIVQKCASLTHFLTRLTCIDARDVNLTLQYLKSDLKIEKFAEQLPYDAHTGSAGF